MRNVLVVAFPALCCACGGGRNLGDIADLTIIPSKVSLPTSADATSDQAFSVTATFDNGAEQEDFDLVSWSLSNTAVGSVDDAGVFTTSSSVGGVTWLTAETNGITANAAITVVYQEDVVDDGVPDDADAAFDGTPDQADDKLFWVYPEDGVALPRNLPEFTFMWGDTLACNLYRLTFSSDTTNVTILTRDRQYTVPSEVWKVITATNAGSDVTVSLEGVNATVTADSVSNVTGHYAGGEISFRVNRFDAQGAVYYWSVTNNGIMRSAVDEADPELWFGKANDTVDTCVGCHVLSPQGDRVAYTWQPNGEAVFRMGIGSIDEDVVPSPMLQQTDALDEAEFATWSPDGEKVVFAYDGKLTIYDGWTGEKLGTVPSDLDLTQPSWSPKGDVLVAVAATKDFTSDSSFNGGELVLFDIDDAGTFSSEPRVLVPPNTDSSVNQYYPMFSPDGDWVVFNRAHGTPYFNSEAALWLVSVDGGDPIELVKANKGEKLTNSWARWGPIPDDDVLWLAFASRRDYGSASTDGSAHIWVSAIDTTKAEEGEDPSYPAFWLVQQSVGEGNHAPWWSAY